MLVQTCEGRVPTESAAGQSSNRGELGSSSHEEDEVVPLHRGGDVGPDIQNLSIQGDDVDNRHPTGEADEGEEIPAIVEEIERVDRHALEDEENLTAEGNDDEDDQEVEEVPMPASWNLEDPGYIAENTCHDSIWFDGDGQINLGAMFRDKTGLQDAVKSWSFQMQRQFRVVRSSKSEYTVVCETEGCTFRIHGHVPKESHHNLTAAYVAKKYYKEIIEDVVFCFKQKRQADNKYRRSMHLRMTPWIEAWSQALNDVIHETRAYDHSTYEQYMAWYSSQTRIRLLAPEDPDERAPPNVDQTYDMQHAPPAHLTTDIAGELVRETKTLWEKLRDGIAGTNQEVMAAVDSLRRKGKRIMRLASCRHSSEVYTTATSRRMFEQMPERPSTSSRPSTSARPSVSARRSTDAHAAVRSTSVREAPTIPTIPEITQMSARLGGFDPTQEGTRMVRPVPQMPHPRPHMIPQMTPDVPTSHWQEGFAPFAGPTQSVPLQAPTYGTNPWQGQSIDYGASVEGRVPNELRALQTDDAPQMTQPTQPDDDDFQGNIHDPRRSNRERHEPNHLSLSGPRHGAGRRKKTASKRGDTSRTMTDHDEE
uniref:Transposase MuDR plant domain-containing protein n=1 Tax=Oryza punctata TaxID=4537 RepID=A0A0E0MDZ5_ORYPU